MLYIGGLITGIVNGIFASGAGQIFVFFLIYFLKIDTHKARATSVICITITTLISIIGYVTIANFKWKEIIIVATVSVIFGNIGAKLMNKINSNVLNIISGLVIAGFSLYKIIFG